MVNYLRWHSGHYRWEFELPAAPKKEFALSEEFSAPIPAFYESYFRRMLPMD